MGGRDKFTAQAFLEELIARVAAGGCERCESEQVAAGLGKVLEELRRTAEFDFRELGDHVYDGIYIADGAGKTLYVNKAYTRITGIAPEEVVGRYVEECEAAGLYKNAVTPEVIRLKKRVNSVGVSLRSGRKMLITGIPVFDAEENVKNVVVIDREITDLLTMKAELDASQEKMKAVEADKAKSIMEIEHLRRQNLNMSLIGRSEGTAKVIEAIRQVAPLDVTVLIAGETGVGKEVVANEIYTNSPRNKGPFIKVNCAAIPANLLEAELFGYEKGAFTGAAGTGRLGLFELADKGTLLLDEIGDMPLELQSKLLRVIQHKEITRIGGTRPFKLDVRILAATNCDLRSLVTQGRFREDLYYRLNVFPIVIPPLRARAEDVEPLAEHFLALYNAKYGKVTVIEDAGLEIMKHYSWPGNIRELQNIVERLVIVAEPAAVIGGEQLAPLLNVYPGSGEPMTREAGLKEIVANIEKKTLERVLGLYGSTRKAAKVLKVDQSTIVKKAKKFGLKLGDDN
ncbi:sigma-54 interaction domain-containing protein [Anaeroselena agilis]|uniref:HTH-type transcriptional regulatory protein TyrR n=1 Tax=Anaeroselena agilis TaxID=3063788 RepID=A0ABU3P053_9FIRM|nr:sigma 54-interacting transcriptional regulator [Selenomonadales bacterium 4137-cl]